MEPLVSVIVPIYNVEAYLPLCVKSILDQTFSNLDIILVDDGSTDTSGFIADSYTDPRIRVFHTENNGLSAARNLGIEEARGDYISFIDADDWIDPDLLSTAISQIGSADILCFGNDKRHYPAVSYTGQEALTALLNANLPDSAWSKLYRRECFYTLRFPEGRLFEDIAIAHKLLQSAKLVVCSDFCGYHYRDRLGSITHTYNRQNIMDYCKAHMDRFNNCVDLVDEKAKRNLYKSCAIAILRAWGWRNSIPELKEEKVFCNELAQFSKEKLSSSKLSLPIRLGLYLTKHPSEWSFLLASSALRLYRWIKYWKSTP